MMIKQLATHGRRALRGAAVVALGTLLLVACDSDTAPPFEVEGQGSISGLLYFDEGRDGQFEPLEGDFPLAGIPVYLRVRGTTQVLPGTETVTDAEGRFSIPNVPIGTHDIVFETAGVATICNSPRAVSVRIGEVTSAVISGQESCLIPIAEARALAIGTPVTVRGVVTVGSGDLSSSYFFVQDETAGIKVFTAANTALGQFVEVSGTMDLFSGEVEIANASITTLGTAPVPDPIVITGEEHLSSDYQGSLVTVLGLEVTNVVLNVSGGDNVTVSAPDGSVFLIRADFDGVTPGSFTVGNVYDVTGVVSPFGGAEQLYPRSNADIVLVP